MPVSAIITEYDPLHSGHVHLLRETRRLLGPETDILCVMSGCFTQRGEFAVLRPHARAEAAVRSGADLVLELPLPWAVSSAERFAEGGVKTLLATGLVTHLSFGSECGDAAALKRVAQALCSPDFSAAVQAELSRGDEFASARQRAVSRLLAPEDAELLSSPNNTLGIEYAKALFRADASVELLSIPRLGAAHDGEAKPGEHPSASAIRRLLRAGEEKRARSLMAPAMAEIYDRERETGRAPVFGETCERAILARLRTMDETEFAALDEGREGLYRRLYDACRRGRTVTEILEIARTKRYAYARLRRMLLWAYLGLRPGDCPDEVPYLRPLAMNERGRVLLAQMRKTAAVPVLTKAAEVRRLGPEAQALFAEEAKAIDLYTLAYPELSAAEAGSIWRMGPVIL